MKQFFYQLLQDLKLLTGSNQYEKMLALPENEQDIEVDELLKVLCRASGMFPMIPQSAQKSILQHAVVTDTHFIGLNAAFVYRALNVHKDRYFKESHHVNDGPGPDWKPVEGEARQNWLKEWEKTLLETQGGMTTVSHVKELEQTLPKKPEGVTYNPSNGAQGFAEELFEMQQLRAEYARECRDLHTGKLLEGKPLFSEWIKTKK